MFTVRTQYAHIDNVIHCPDFTLVSWQHVIETYSASFDADRNEP